MQDTAITILSTSIVLLQPAYPLCGYLHLGKLGLLLLGAVGCLGGLMIVLHCLFRADAYEPGQVYSVNDRGVGEDG
jgi:hypothetical protein